MIMRGKTARIVLLGSMLALAACQQGEGAGESRDMPPPDISPSVAVMPSPDLPDDQTTAEEKAAQEKAAADAGLPPTVQSRTRFTCADGSAIELRFFPEQGVAVLLRNGGSQELQAEPAGEAYRYRGDGVLVEGKDNSLNLTIGTTPDIACTAAAG